MKEESQSPALQHVLHVWDNVSRSSWQRLNSAMFSALQNAIGSGMRFDEGDIVHLAGNCRMRYWVGESDEGLYSAACGGSRGDFNLSAAIAFEKYFQRPAWLWAEKAKTPTRLHVGERFTWSGHLVTITSFNDAKKSLIACTYKDSNQIIDDGDPRVGGTGYVFGAHRTIEAFNKYEDGSLAFRVSAPIPYESRVIARRFTITHDELMKVRKAADAKVRSALKQIKDTETLDKLEEVRISLTADGSGYRHFDIEAIRAAFLARKEAIEESLSESERRAHAERLAATHAEDLERWMKGERVNRHFDVVRLRVTGDWVETTTNQRASLKGSRTALKFALRHRAKGWQANGKQFDLDQFPVRSIDREGVQVGCTYIPWTEIDRVAPLLK